jgi:hypothetical protein
MEILTAIDRRGLMRGLEVQTMSDTNWQLYAWDEIGGVVATTTEDAAAIDPNWRLTHVTREGVRCYRSERNHLAMMVYAPSEKEAIAKFDKHEEFFH